MKKFLLVLTLTTHPLLAADDKFELLSRYPKSGPAISIGEPGSADPLCRINALEGSENRLWAATDGGLMTLDLKTGNWALVWDKPGAFFEPVRALSYTRPLLWAACDNGLFRLDLDSKKCRKISEGQGLLSPRVRHLASDKDGVWLSYEYPDPSYVQKTPGSTTELEERPAKITRLDREGKLVKHWTLPKAPSHRTYDDYSADPSRPGDLLQAFLRLLGGTGTAWAAEDPDLEGTYEWVDNKVLDLFAEGKNLWVSQPGVIRRLALSRAHFSTWRFERILNQKTLYRYGMDRARFFKEKDKVLLVSERNWMVHDPAKDLWDKVPGKVGPPLAQGKDLVWVGSSYDMTNASRFVLRYLKDKDPAPKDDIIIYDSIGLYRWDVRCLLPIQEGVWIGTLLGLHRFDTKTRVMERFKPILTETTPEGKASGRFAFRMKVEKVRPDPTPTPWGQ